MTNDQRLNVSLAVTLVVGLLAIIAFVTMATVIVSYQQNLLNLERRLLQEQAEHRCRKEALMLGLYEAQGVKPPPDPDPNPTDCARVYFGGIE